MESQIIIESETAGSPLPQPNNHFTVIWKNLTYKVDPRSWLSRVEEKCVLGCRVRAPSEDVSADIGSKKKVILDNLCGDIKSGQLTGILGPSGAGKTSLMRCLFQNCGDGTTGQILVEGGNKRLKVCFIPQKDYLNDFLTVREDLVYVSRLRSTKIKDDGAISCAQTRSDSYVIGGGKQRQSCLIDHDMNAVQVAESLGLGSCLDVLVKNISGGQRKRLSIARELMSKPDIIILDEPTTGLDSVTCYKTIMVLQDLAHHSDHPVAVIVTIHQPPKNVFKLFDKTYFISNQGRVLFEDVPDKVTQTLKDVAASDLPTPNYNPASALIEIAADTSRNDVIDSLNLHQMQKFDTLYPPATIKTLMNQKTKKNYGLLASRNLKYQKNTITSNETSPTTPDSTESNSKDEDNSDQTRLEDCDYFISPKLQDCLSSHSFGFVQSLRHICILTHRFWFSIARNSTLTKTRLMFHTLAPLVMLIVFGTESSTANNCPKFDTPLDLKGLRRSLAEGTVEKNVDELRLCYQNLSLFFILLYGFGINIVSLASTQYPLTINMFKKETINGLYSASSYFLAQTIAEFPMEILYPSLSVILAYSLSGQTSSYLEWRMFGVVLSVCVCCYTMHSLGLLCGIIFVNNPNVATIAGQASLWLPIMLSGCLIRLPRMPDWMHTMSYISFMKHGLAAIIAARYGFNLCGCTEELLQDEDRVIGLNRMPDNVKHVIEYMFPVNETNGINVVDMFDKLGDRFAQAQTFGAPEIKSCDDVQPHMMTEFGFKDSDLFYGPLYMIVMTFVFKLITYYYIRGVPYRVK